DIYQITMPEAAESALVLFLGLVLPAPCDILPASLEVQVTETESNTLFGIYRPQPGTGSFTMILAPGKKYSFSYLVDGKEIRNEKVETSNDQVYQEIYKEIQLDPVVLDPTKNQQLPCLTANLDVKVYNNNKERQLLTNTEIVLVDKIGRKVKAYANEKGVIEPIKIRIDDEFTLTAKSGEKDAKVVKFNTSGIAENTSVVKELFLGQTEIFPIDEPDTGIKMAPAYTFYFKYNKNEIDLEDPAFKAFIAKVVQYAANKDKLDITIVSSASEVPTKTFGNNKKLAASRAKVSNEKVMKALKAANLGTRKIKVKETAEVNGPKYSGDYLVKMAEYEKYQYVQISVK
ncbi:MAG TPA: hypothetical protein VGF30_15365, partial [Bacteroidia bacterium]